MQTTIYFILAGIKLQGAMIGMCIPFH